MYYIRSNMPAVISFFACLLAVFFVVSCSSVEPSANNAQKSAANIIKQNGESALKLHSDKALPVDEKIVSGTLDNGIGYIIRENTKPENFAELRLVVEAGSLHEDEDQLGFAHFVEHMAFNGTEDFKEQEIVEFVESIGMRFGAHLNASTTFDHTVYKLRVPSDKPEILEKAIHILENWAHKVSFNAKDIDEERGVVLEEWRGRKGVGERISKAQWPIMFAGTDYPKRLPIGTEDSILSGSHEALRRFYTTWYQPQRMSVVAVGDFDEANVESLIKRYFSKITKTADTPFEKQQVLQQYNRPVFHILKDDELTGINLSTSWRNNHPPKTYDLKQYKQSVIDNVASTIIAKRLSELSLDTSSAFTSVRMSHNQLLPTAEEFSFRANVKPGRTAEAFESLLIEVKRAIDHGVSEQELNTEKELYLQWFDSALASQNTLSHGAYLRSYVNHVLKDTGLTSLEQDYALSKQFLEQINVDDIHQQLKKWTKSDNAVVFITAPSKLSTPLPDKEALGEIWQNFRQATTDINEDKVRVTELLSEVPAAGKIVDTTFNEKYQAEQWTLSNGVNIIVKKTDFKENQILFRAISDGGYATVDDDTYLSSFGMMNTINFLGLGDLDMQALNRFSKEKQFSLNAQVNNYSESLQGTSNIEDFELMMQSIYLRFTAPVKNQERFDWIKENFRPRLQNKYNRPEAKFKAAIKEKTAAGDPRSVEFDVDLLDRQNMDTIFDVYSARFANAADFTFIFVGDIDMEAMKTYAQLYLATLPVNDIVETRQKLPSYPLRGDIQVHMQGSDEPKARVIYSLFGDADWSYRNQQVMAALRSALSNSLRNRLREELAGVYSVQLSSRLTRWPYPEYSVNVTFSCDPNRVDELHSEMLNVFEQYKQGDIDENLLKNYKTQAKTNRNKKRKENSFWMGYISSFYSSTPALPLEQYEALLDSITMEDLQVAAKLYLSGENRLYATLKPKDQVESEDEAKDHATK